MMNSWFVKNLGDALLAGDMLEHIKSLFMSEYEKSNCPRDMAIFVRHESEGQLHCEVKVYFPPSTAVVARAVDAVDCVRPSADDLGLLAGSDAARSMLFAGD